MASNFMSRLMSSNNPSASTYETLREQADEPEGLMKLAKPSTMIGTPVIQGTSVADRLTAFHVWKQVLIINRLWQGRLFRRLDHH